MGGCGNYSNAVGRNAMINPMPPMPPAMSMDERPNSYYRGRGGRPSVSRPGQDRRKCSVTCGYGPRAGRVCSGACSLNLTEGMCCSGPGVYMEEGSRNSRNFMGFDGSNRMGYDNDGMASDIWFNQKGRGNSRSWSGGCRTSGDCVNDRPADCAPCCESMCVSDSTGYGTCEYEGVPCGSQVYQSSKSRGFSGNGFTSY